MSILVVGGAQQLARTHTRSAHVEQGRNSSLERVLLPVTVNTLLADLVRRARTHVKQAHSH